MSQILLWDCVTVSVSLTHMHTNIHTHSWSESPCLSCQGMPLDYSSQCPCSIKTWGGFVPSYPIRGWPREELTDPGTSPLLCYFKPVEISTLSLPWLQLLLLYLSPWRHSDTGAHRPHAHTHAPHTRACTPQLALP